MFFSRFGGNLVPAAVKLVDGVKKLVSRNGRTYDVPDAPSRTPVTNPTPAQSAAATQYGVDPRWVKPDGTLDYPPYNGFDGGYGIIELQPGQTFDRYGGYYSEAGDLVDTGIFASPSNVPFEQRSLNGSRLNDPHQEYVVLQPLPEVKSGTTAPWFDQPSGGVQYELPASIDDLIQGGYIAPVQQVGINYE